MVDQVNTEKKIEIPETLPLLPVRDIVIFPYMVVPILVIRDTSIAALQWALMHDRFIFLVLQKNPETDNPCIEDRRRVGGVGRALRAMKTRETAAEILGVNVARTKLIVLAAASMMAAAAVAVAGVIGFVGLIVPHAVRMLFGGDYRQLLPLSAILGATFVILVDLVARQALAPQDVPVGIVTQVLGAPFFLYLLRTRRLAGSL